MERLLILNPGSTSTKLAVFDGEEPLFVESITHSAEELAPFDCVADQYEFRRELVLDCLKRQGPTRSTTTWCGSSRTSPRTSTPPTWAR